MKTKRAIMEGGWFVVCCWRVWMIWGV